MKCYKLTTSWVTNTLIQFSACVLFFKSIFLPIDYHLNTFLPSDRLSSKHIPFLPIDYHLNIFLSFRSTIIKTLGYCVLILYNLPSDRLKYYTLLPLLSFRSTLILYYTSFPSTYIQNCFLLSAFLLSAFLLSAFLLSASLYYW